MCNKTWNLVSLEKGKNLIDCKWVNKIKRKANGDIDMYKACLVAKCFKQRYGIGYEDTFSHVIKPATIRTIFFSCSVKGMVFSTVGYAKHVSFHSVLEEEVYMKQPPGYGKFICLSSCLLTG